MPARHCKSAFISSYCAESIYDFRNGIYDRFEYVYMTGQIELCPVTNREILRCYIEVQYPCSADGFRSIICDSNAIVRFHAFASREQLIATCTEADGRLDGPYTYE